MTHQEIHFLGSTWPPLYIYLSPATANYTDLEYVRCLFCFFLFSPFFFPQSELFIFLMTFDMFEDIVNRVFSSSSRSAAMQTFRNKRKRKCLYIRKEFNSTRIGLKH